MTTENFSGTPSHYDDTPDKNSATNDGADVVSQLLFGDDDLLTTPAGHVDDGGSLTLPPTPLLDEEPPSTPERRASPMPACPDAPARPTRAVDNPLDSPQARAALWGARSISAQERMALELEIDADDDDETAPPKERTRVTIERPPSGDDDDDDGASSLRSSIVRINHPPADPYDDAGEISEFSRRAELPQSPRPGMKRPRSIEPDERRGRPRRPFDPNTVTASLTFARDIDMLNKRHNYHGTGTETAGRALTGATFSTVGDITSYFDEQRGVDNGELFANRAHVTAALQTVGHIIGHAVASNITRRLSDLQLMVQQKRISGPSFARSCLEHAHTALQRQAAVHRPNGEIDYGLINADVVAEMLGSDLFTQWGLRELVGRPTDETMARLLGDSTPTSPGGPTDH